MMKRFVQLLLAIAVIGVVLAGCSNDEDTVTIGYFPNLTHVASIVALEEGYFAEEFGEDITIETQTFSNGGLFMEAMQTNEIDVGTVGPGPLLNIYLQNPEFHIISGAVNGGAVLVTSEESGIESLEDLDGKRVAIPVIGSTQDVMLRKALQEVGLEATSSGGTVEMHAAAPADTATLFVQNSVDAAATQEPWGYILETQAGGELLLDYDEFAWGEESTNTVVAARSDFKENTELTEQYLQAHKRAVEFIQENPEEAQQIVIQHIQDLTGKEIDKEETAAAFSRLRVTTDVNEQVIQEMADISLEAEYVDSNDIEGMIDLSILEGME
ncbi:aliphatic sulfonate ABC transporter substrate-binding protein [Oceanobacillus sp. AG]|uniref:aliphatic sulfonate ABC transporter substrate-binding protein n=1 Tax=Oceanobacillus sp. AG TaxID=2681969 RepID=UPI0012EB2CF6|nr:aliphatic sulfonate ABC transporter substrate-binding protein [Oceanobacillus sp. AG]